MRKKGLGFLIVLTVTLALSGSVSLGAGNPLDGRIIALDAGHGGTENGAVNQKYQVAEKDVNIAVVYALKSKLEVGGACVVLTRVGDETITSRRKRVNLAKEKCKSECSGKCDVLVSVHHNGSTDPTYDGTMVIYNEKQDIPLATALHDALILELGLLDEGYEHGGYGMTVYGHLVSALTEAYYITNDGEAELYLNGDRVGQEAQALHQGLIDYFSSSSENGGGNGGDKCPPGKEKQGKC